MSTGRFHGPAAVLVVGLLLMIVNFPYKAWEEGLLSQTPTSDYLSVWGFFFFGFAVLSVGGAWLLMVSVKEVEKSPRPRSSARSRKTKKRRRKKR